MAVNIDTVYQRVLALANKEQRGYITPQEFNLFANQAQMEIFEQYFYDLNQFRRVHGNQTSYADVDDMLQEKIQLFEKEVFQSTINVYTDPDPLNVPPEGTVRFILPEDVYRINRVYYNNAECEILNTRDFNHAINGGPLLRPSDSRPIVNISGNIARCVISGNVEIRPTRVIYIKKPTEVQWGYIVSMEKPLYNPFTAIDFELHASEETELVYKILKYAGVSIRRQDLPQVAQGMEISQIQQEKQ